MSLFISIFLDCLILIIPIFFLFLFFKTSKKKFLFLSIIFVYLNIHRFLEFFYIEECSEKYLFENVFFEENKLEKEKNLKKRLYLCPFTNKQAYLH
jgi:phosphoglycerol transferase MdoB-like AlkP superfamily enzyme